jgi:hypothetical protein
MQRRSIRSVTVDVRSSVEQELDNLEAALANRLINGGESVAISCLQ